MTAPDMSDEPAVAWSVAGERFEMQVHDNTAVFFHPDGQVIEMSSREWTILARAVGLLMGQHEPSKPETARKQFSKPKVGKSGQRWTENDAANLLDRWEKGDTVGDLMARFDRQEGGIASRLVRLKVAPNREDVLTESRRRRRSRLADEQTAAGHA